MKTGRKELEIMTLAIAGQNLVLFCLFLLAFKKFFLR
jgi:hypothetical protein